MDQFLSSLIPESNRLESAYAPRNGAGTKAALLAAQYDAGFVGAFRNNEEFPDWARRAARYMKDDFFANTPGHKKLFSDVSNQLADGDGERHVNCRHAMELWIAGGRKGPEPFTCNQDYGSCVDASASEHETALFGWRIAVGGQNEEFLRPAAWYKYGNRGYCSDGWSGSGIAAVARRVGCAFRCPYQLGDLEVDFTDDDENENIVARRWCRSGIPSVMVSHTQANHGYEDGAITSYNGDYIGFKKALKAGGALHAGGVRTSGGPKPFTGGRTGPHMQSTIGYDDTEECRKWFRDNHGISWATDDFPLVNMQTWGSGWRGECADQYWPTHLWGPKPQGAWVCSAKWWFDDVEYVWLPWAKGFPKSGPVPGPVKPLLSGSVFAEQAGQIIAVRGEIFVGDLAITIVPDGAGKYRPIYTPSPV